MSTELIKSLITFKTREEIVSFAQKNDLDLSEKQVERILQASEKTQLSAEELDKVIGGVWVDPRGYVHTDS